MSRVKVTLFTSELEPLGEYFTPSVPREGEYLNWDDVLYEINSVTWGGLPDQPTAQVRLSRGNNE